MCGARNPRLTETSTIHGSDGVATALARNVTLEVVSESSGQSG